MTLFLGSFGAKRNFHLSFLRGQEDIRATLGHHGLEYYLGACNTGTQKGLQSAYETARKELLNACFDVCTVSLDQVEEDTRNEQQIIIKVPNQAPFFGPQWPPLARTRAWPPRLMIGLLGLIPACPTLSARIKVSSCHK